MGEQISYLAYLIGWKIVGALPEKSAYTFFNQIAAVMYRRNGKSVRRLRSNYLVVRPELSSTELETLVLSGLKSYLR